MYDVLWVHVLQGDEDLSDVESGLTLRQTILPHYFLEQLSSGRTGRVVKDFCSSWTQKQLHKTPRILVWITPIRLSY